MTELMVWRAIVGLLALYFALKFGPGRYREWKREQREAEDACTLCWRKRMHGDRLCWMHRFESEDQ